MIIFEEKEDTKEEQPVKVNDLCLLFAKENLKMNSEFYFYLSRGPSSGMEVESNDLKTD